MADTDNSLDFSTLEPIAVPVRYGGKSYTLREATGGAAVKYRNAMLACARLGPDGKPVSVSGLADLEPMLIASCLFDEQGKPVPDKTVREWPSRVLRQLFETAKRISGLDEGETPAPSDANGHLIAGHFPDSPTAVEDQVKN